MRLSGLALIVGGLGASFAQIVHPDTPDPAAIEPYLQTAVPVHFLLYLAVITLGIGFTGLIAHFRSWLALIGGVTMIFGLQFEDGMHSVFEFGLLPAIFKATPGSEFPIANAIDGDNPMAILQFLAAPLITLAAVLLTIEVFRLRTIRAWPAVLMLTSVVLFLISSFLPGGELIQILRVPSWFYLAHVGFGLELLRATHEPGPDLGSIFEESYSPTTPN
jgi:hypothetical protein